MLTACASGTQPTPVQNKATPEVSAALMTDCAPLPVAVDGTLSTLLQNHTDVAFAYAAVCKSKSDLSNAIKAQPGISVK